MGAIEKIRNKLIKDEKLIGIYNELVDKFKNTPEEKPEYLKTYQDFVNKVKPEPKPADKPADKPPEK